jgi:Phage integrase family
MESAPLLDCAGRRRSPATMPGYHRGRPPRNKGLRYPPDPPSVEEIIAVMRAAGDDIEGLRLRGLIVMLWRAGLRISEALALTESDLDRARGAVLIRSGKGGKRRKVGMDRWAWEQLDPWLELRPTMPVGALFCILRGPTRGRQCQAATIRVQLRNAAVRAGVRRRFAPHQLRHAHAVEMSREGVPLLIIQRQLGHANLSITSVYLRGIDNTEIIHTVHERPAPMIPGQQRTANGGLRQTGFQANEPSARTPFQHPPAPQCERQRPGAWQRKASVPFSARRRCAACSDEMLVPRGKEVSTLVARVARGVATHEQIAVAVAKVYRTLAR